LTPELYSYQVEAINKMKNGCILCGGVGSGKSRTALAYYFSRECGGSFDGLAHGYKTDYVPMSEPKDLYIITTARKRDTLEWHGECTPFLFSPYEEANSYSGKMKVVVDSWNNIGKYVDVNSSFFIFDEQRVVGKGAWVKAFLKITKKNRWILLSATPGDTWTDYIPVFLANGFYRNRTDFADQHIVYSRFSKYPKVDKYVNTGKLMKLRKEILVTMDYNKSTINKHINVSVDYDRELFKSVMVRRWDVFENEPIKDAASLCYVLRKVVNSDEDRLYKMSLLISEHPRAIIFYNFDYELEMIRGWARRKQLTMKEWNGHKHEPIPEGDKWVYVVQYTAGAEGWNCITTDTIIFYSQNYSYKTMVQAAGRIDRLNSPFSELLYFHLCSSSSIDLAIKRALKSKKTFNESNYIAKAC